MPKNHKYIFLLESIIILLFFSGCLKNNTNELNEEILQNISNQYKVNCPIVSAESVLDIKKIELPKEIKNLKISCYGILDSDNLLINLYEENGAITSIKELGKYGINDQSYTTIFEYIDNYVYDICAYNNEYLIIKIGDNEWWSHADLYLYNINLKSLKLIFDYSTDSNGELYYFPFNNNILIKDNVVYFDDFWKDKDQIRASLYQYDINTDTVVKIVDDAQNPLPLGDEIIYFSKKNNSYKYIESISGKFSCNIEAFIHDIDTNKNQIFSIDIIENDEIKHETLFGIYTWNNDKCILETIYPIDKLNADDNFVTFTNNYEAIPILYDINNDRVIAFDELYGISNWFFDGDYRILHLTNNSVNTLYMFSLKET